MTFIKWVVVIIAIIVFGGCSVNKQIVAQGVNEAPNVDNYENGRFHNHQQVEPNSFKKTLGILGRYITEKRTNITPKKPIAIKSVTAKMLNSLANNTVHVIKLGHSSVLLKVHGEYWLLDPVFSERASPFSFLGPKRFSKLPISISELPPIDKVLISHNHYDHLDKSAIKKLSAKTKQFYVPLGVDTDLVKWGVNENKISTFNWWQELQTEHALVAFTPTQHFSGRGLSDANNTLWGSWVIKTSQQSVYFSGDSGYFAGFKEIGNKYGPFDLTLIETGAYDKDWADIHMTPEQSVQAHIDLQGKTLVPIHNGTFDLAFHAWVDPFERVTAASNINNVTLSTPEFGQIFTPTDAAITHKWWKN